jgi:membrane-bound lytic murein transglycosylase B
MRVFLIAAAALTASACVPAADRPPPAPPSEAQPAPAVPPPPVPPAPPEPAAAFLALPVPELAPTGDARFDAYRERVLQAGGPGWRQLLLRAFATARPNPLVLQSLEPEPADAAAYVRRYATPARIALGQRLYRELQGRTLFRGEQTVPTEYLLALWGAYADYGVDEPPFDAIEALLNAGAYERGPHWTEFQIFRAVTILAQGRVPRDRLLSYANGRLGQVRFLPDQFLDWAEDGDGDGRMDVWTSRADILRNLQRLLAAPWEPGAPAMIEVLAPDPVPGRPRAFEGSSVRLTSLRSPDGRPWPDAWAAASGEILQPFGPEGPYYLATRNFTPLNFADPHRSRHGPPRGPGFALAMTVLAERIAGRPGPDVPGR